MTKCQIITKILLLLAVYASCQKIINIQPVNIQPVLIINAQFDPEKQKDTIYISLSNNNNATELVDLTVKNAEVTLKDIENNITYPLHSKNNGYYTLDTPITNLHSTYRLSILYQNKTYTSTTKIAKKIQQFNGKLEKIPSLQNRNTYLLTYQITDAEPNQFNYYKVRLIIDSNYQKKEYFYTNDSKKINTSTIKDNSFINISPNLNEKSNIEYEVQSLSKEAYYFFQEVQQLNPNRSFTLNEKSGNPAGTFDKGAIGVFSIGFTSKFKQN